MTTTTRTSVEPALRAAVRVVAGYRSLFVSGPAAPVLNRPHPVHRRGFARELAVAATARTAEDVLVIRLRSPRGTVLPAWTPGAHLDVGLPSGRVRQYSLCGDPADRRSYRIAVRRMADGAGGSVELHDSVRPGDRLTVRGPRQAFPLVPARSYLFVAAGIGITPILPMVRSAARARMPWRLVYLGRSRAGMPFLDELAGVPGGVLEVHAGDERGRADLAAVFAHPAAAVYACGPPAVLAAAQAVPATAALFTERFAAPPVPAGAPFTVTLARDGTRVAVAADESLLAAVGRVRPGVVHSCRQGFCGTCRTRVLAGDVDHRDRLLLEGERADSMLICVSRSAGGPLVLDL